MTINFYPGKEPPIDLVDVAQELLQEVAEDIARMVRKAKQGEFDEVKAMPGVIKNLREILLLVIEERGRVDKLRKHVAGTVGPGQFDFQSARDEIGSRLARLRGAGAGG